MLESKRRAVIFIILSFVLALSAGFIFMQKVKALNTELGEMAQIYVAGTNISSRSVIQPGQIKTMTIPKKYVSTSYITDKNALINKVSVVPLSAGDIITKNMIKDVSDVRDENDRLVALFASDRIQFDQELQALDRVDIFVSQQVDGKPETKVFMTDVKVEMVSEDKGQFRGVALEVPFDKVAELIYVQNYADSIRVLKANVGQPTSMSSGQSKNDPNAATNQSKENNTQQPPQQDKNPKAKN